MQSCSVKFVMIKKTVHSTIQFCAGHKLPVTKEIQVWEYDGDSETTMTFKKKDKRVFRIFNRDIPGLDYHIGGKCQTFLDGHYKMQPKERIPAKGIQVVHYTQKNI